MPARLTPASSPRCMSSAIVLRKHALVLNIVAGTRNTGMISGGEDQPRSTACALPNVSARAHKEGIHEANTPPIAIRIVGAR